MPRAAFLRARPPPCVMRPQKRYPKWKKRRLYDVMSICQCLRVVERSCKSQFIWRGIRRVQSAVYEFLLRDMAVRPILDGHTELDPDEPAVPVTGGSRRGVCSSQRDLTLLCRRRECGRL